MRSDKIVFRFVIRYGRQRDLESLCEITRARSKERIRLGMKGCRVTEKLKARWLEWLTTSRNDPKDPIIVLVAEADGKVVGFAVAGESAQFSERHAPWWIYVVAVHVDHRRQGFGTALVSMMAKEARKVWSAEKIGLRTSTANKRAQRIYRRCGFRVAEKTKKTRLWEGQIAPDYKMVKQL